MDTGRRLFISSVAVTLAGTQTLFASLQRQPPPVRVPRMPDGMGPDSSPDDEPAIPPPNPRERLEESQKNLRRDADQLLELAQDLKVEADKTEQTDVLSLSLVKKAEAVEKLAHRIKELVRAA